MGKGYFNQMRRYKTGSFIYPYGSYPETGFAQQEGYDVCYVEEDSCNKYKIALSFEKLAPIFFRLAKLLPETVSFAIKIHSDDYKKNYDTYVSDKELPLDEFLAWIVDWQDVIFDDGFIAISLFAERTDEEVFIDEHKNIVLHYKKSANVEQILKEYNVDFKFQLEFLSDTAHAHKPLSHFDKQSDDYLTAFEDLADSYNLYLNLDEEEARRDSDYDIPEVTSWKVELRSLVQDEHSSTRFYSTLYLNAISRANVVEIVDENFKESNVEVDLFLKIARVPVELIHNDIAIFNINPNSPEVWFESERIFLNS